MATRYNKEVRITATLAAVALSFIVDHWVPGARDLGVVHKCLSLIFLVTVTEQIAENVGMRADFGLMPYLLSLLSPCLFPLTSICLHSYVQEIPLYSDIQGALLGNEYRAVYRGGISFHEVHSEHSASRDIEAISGETQKSYWMRESLIFIGLVASFGVVSGPSGILIAAGMFMVYSALQSQSEGTEVVKTSDCQSIPGRKGVYAIEISNLWADRHVGVGYLSDGTFTTKYHVTHAKPIYLDNVEYKPCYYNTEADIVSYGAPPRICDVSDGDEIVVALSGPHSSMIVTYRTVVTVNTKGYVVFKGRKSTPGTSGSPFFKKITKTDDEVDYVFAGCIGWSVRAGDIKNNEITEVAKNTGMNTGSEEMGRGDLIQKIAHPGSGKTHNISEMIQRGLHMYGRVYIAGPTRGVAAELVQAYDRNPIEGITPRVLIKDTTKSRAMSKVTITTHATALRMLAKKDTTVTQPGLWIIDESHFSDKATQCLKHLLRHRIHTKQMEGTLYEMTATAYDIKARKWCYADGSNYSIEDVQMSTEEMVEAITTSEARKSIVFVTSIKGKERTSSEQLYKLLKLRGKTVIEMNRPNFTQSYPKAKTGNFDFVLTTSIAECGVNLDAEVVYDFQKNPKPMVRRWDDIAISSADITKGQLIQRRGRIGRTKPGVYIGPKPIYSLVDVQTNEAMHLDIALFNKEFDITPMEPVYLTDEAENLKCSHEQIMYLFAEGERATVNSPLTLQMIMESNGQLRSSESIMEYVTRWYEHGEVVRKNGQVVATALFWDDRDVAFYWQWHDIMSMRDPGDRMDRESLVKSMRQKIFDIGKAIKYRGIWISPSLPMSGNEFDPTDSDDFTRPDAVKYARARNRSSGSDTDSSNISNRIKMDRKARARQARRDVGTSSRDSSK